jgi:hypothetical protein
MGPIDGLMTFAWGSVLPMVFKPLGGSVGGRLSAVAVKWLHDRIVDPSSRPTVALQRATRQAWESLRDSTVDARLLARAEDRAVRTAVRDSLSVAEINIDDLRAELKVVLSTPHAVPGPTPDALARLAEPMAAVRFHTVGLNLLSDGLRAAGFVVLPVVIGLPSADGDGLGLLGTLVRYHFRRAVEDDPQLFQGLAFDQLDRLEQGQTAGVEALAELMARYADRTEDRLSELWTMAHETQLAVRQLTGPSDSVIDLVPTTGNSFGGHSGPVRDAVWLTPHERMASAGGCDVRIWDTVRGTLVRTMSVPSEPLQLVVVNGRVLVGTAAGGLHAFDPDTGGEVFRSEAVFGSAFAFAAVAAVAVGGSPFDGKLRVFDLATRKDTRRLSGHADLVTAVGLSSDGRTVVSGDRSGGLKLWDATSGRQLRTLPTTAGVRTLGFFSDDRRVFAVRSDRVVVWDAFTGRATAEILGAWDVVRPMSRNRLLVATAGTLGIWDSRSRSVEPLAEVGVEGVSCVGIGSAEVGLLIGRPDGGVRVGPIVS